MPAFCNTTSSSAATTVVTLVTVTLHATHYQSRSQQRQVIRVLLMPMVYALVSFFSYRFFRSYTYYTVAESAYESICLSAFLLLMTNAVAESTTGDIGRIMSAYWTSHHANSGPWYHDQDGSFSAATFPVDLKEGLRARTKRMNEQLTEVMQKKDKRKMPFPFNFIRFRSVIHPGQSPSIGLKRRLNVRLYGYRASKPYFLHAVKWSVLQYVIIRPLISIIAIICQVFGAVSLILAFVCCHPGLMRTSQLCPEQYSVHFAEIYLDCVDFVSISVALYGLIVFYMICKDELKGRKPLAKFLAIKLIVFFTFYQSWMFGILASHGVIKATAYWTSDDIVNGLSALATCCEMALFSLYMAWAYPYTEYTDLTLQPQQRKTGVKTYLQAIWDAANIADFAIEIWNAWVFFILWIRGKAGARGNTKFDRVFVPEPLEDDDNEIQMQSPIDRVFNHQVKDPHYGRGIQQNSDQSPYKTLQDERDDFSSPPLDKDSGRGYPHKPTPQMQQQRTAYNYGTPRI